VRIFRLNGWILCAAFFGALWVAPARAAESGANGERAGISSFSAGGGVVAPLGNDYVTLGSAAAFEADLSVSHPAMSPDLDLRFSGFYIPFSVRNIPGASANIGVMGILAGLEFHAPGSQGHISPYFGLQIGANYEFLSYPGGSNTSTNAGISFGARAIPGLEFPFSSSVSLLLEFPGQGLIGKHTVLLAGSIASLRFRP
jgi:hypothetical protein